MLRRSLHVLKNSQYICSSKYFKLHTSTFPVLYSRFDKDLPNASYPVPANKLYGPDTDILLDQLKKCDKFDRLLELINMHLDVMNSKHLVVCLENIHASVRKDPSLRHNLIENAIFKSFCARLMKIVRLLDAQEIITAYKTLNNLEIRNNTFIMQSILKMIGAHLNNMTLGQLTFINYILQKQRHNSLVDGLRLAIPLVLQVQIDQQLDSDNLREVVNCLFLGCGASLKPATIQKIVNAITEKASLLTTEDAVTVIFSLLNINTPVDGYNELINIAFDIVSQNIEDLTSQKLFKILKSCRLQRFYHVKFFYSISNAIVSQKWDLQMTYLAISNLYSLDFWSPDLIDYFAEILCVESKQYQNEELFSPLSCIEYLAATSYRPAKIDEAARVLYSDENKIENFGAKYPHLFLKFLSCLAMIGHFPHKLLTELLNEDILFNILNLNKKMGRMQEFDRYVLGLHWSFQLYDKSKNFTVPASILKKVIHAVYQKTTNVEPYPLTKFLENGLGGSQFLHSGVFTEEGHVIDHVVAMRSGNYPVSLQKSKLKDSKERSVQNVTFVDDFVLPEDAKIITVLVAYEQDYLRDPEIVKSWFDLKVKSLAKKKYAVVVVSYPVWKELPDREKIPYLMREIKLAVKDDYMQKSNCI